MRKEDETWMLNPDAIAIRVQVWQERIESAKDNLKELELQLEQLIRNGRIDGETFKDSNGNII